MEKIYLRDLAKGVGVVPLTLRAWINRYTVCKYVYYDKTNTTKPKICIRGCKDFYIKFSEFLESRKNKKYLKNFQEKYSYLLDK